MTIYLITMSYRKTKTYIKLTNQLIENTKGALCRQYGRLGEECVVALLNGLGYDVKLADDENQEGYDAIIYNRFSVPYGVIQIKTDVDGDGKCSKMTYKQIKYVKNLCDEYGNHLTPYLIEYYPYLNDTMLLYNLDERVWLFSVGQKNFVNFK